MRIDPLQFFIVKLFIYSVTGLCDLHKRWKMVMNNADNRHHFRACNEDIVTEILTRLPVKSLMRFCSVSKPWRTLITKPHFRKQQRGFADRSTPNSRSRLIFRANPLTFIRLEDLEGFRNGLITPTRLEMPQTTNVFEIRDMKLVGACNGLICLEINFSFVLIWNPCTGYSKLSPPKLINGCASRFYGFGYDSVTNDYKVVLVSSPLILYKRSLATLLNHTTLQVFSLKSNRWDFCEWKGTIDTLRGMGYFLNGALHWLEYRYSDFQGSSRIVAFDLGQERFEGIALPFGDHIMRDAIQGGFNGFITFCDRMCVYSGAYYPNNFTVRMLDEYEDRGSIDSWVEVFLNLESSDVLELDRRILYLKPLCVLDSGEVLVDLVHDDGAQLALYDPYEENFRVLIERHLHWEFDSMICEETLVSLESWGGQQCSCCTKFMRFCPSFF